MCEDRTASQNGLANKIIWYNYNNLYETERLKVISTSIQ